MPTNEPSSSQLFRLDLNVSRLTAIQKAAYRFAGDYEIAFESTEDHFVCVRLTPNVATQRRTKASDFLQEVLDQELREAVSDETKGLRDLILAHTFSKFSLTDPVGEQSDFELDPLRVRTRGLNHNEMGAGDG